jgi:lipopolysaccharide transport system ATP-binding protein
MATFECHVPGGLMNDGAYSILMMIVKDSSALYQLEDAVLFEIRDVARDGNWFGKWPGAVRPELDWAHEFASEEGPSSGSLDS